jgi:hypothetical protein
MVSCDANTIGNSIVLGVSRQHMRLNADCIEVAVEGLYFMLVLLELEVTQSITPARVEAAY